MIEARVGPGTSLEHLSALAAAGHAWRPVATRRSVGRGKSFASFGEIVQGRRADGEDFLITLPVDLWSTCRVSSEPVDGPSAVEATLPKSRRIAEEMLRLLGLGSGIRLRIELSRDMPVGKGLSSSTADMLAVLRACEELFGVAVRETLVSRLFTEIEPHEALHYPVSVVYNHCRGRLMKRLDYIPDFQIVAVDAGGEVCTQTYNSNLAFTPTFIAEYEHLYQNALSAFAARDDAAIARCARRSTELHAARTGNVFLDRLLAQADAMGALGLLTAHSGTCGGILLPSTVHDHELAQVQAQVAHLGVAVFCTRTLAAPAAVIRESSRS